MVDDAGRVSKLGEREELAVPAGGGELCANGDHVAVWQHDGLLLRLPGGSVGPDDEYPTRLLVGVGEVEAVAVSGKGANEV